MRQGSKVLLAAGLSAAFAAGTPEIAQSAESPSGGAEALTFGWSNGGVEAPTHESTQAAPEESLREHCERRAIAGSFGFFVISDLDARKEIQFSVAASLPRQTKRCRPIASRIRTSLDVVELRNREELSVSNRVVIKGPSASSLNARLELRPCREAAADRTVALRATTFVRHNNDYVTWNSLISPSVTYKCPV